MENLFDRVFEFLGKPNAESAFDQFMQKLQEAPELLHESKYRREYLLKKSGTLISFSKTHGCFASAFFHSRGGIAEQSAERQPYVGKLIAGITFGDSRDEVERKLGTKPVSSNWIQGRTPEDPKNLYEIYELQPFQLRFVFRRGQLLSSASVHHSGAAESGRKCPREPEEYLYDCCTKEVEAIIGLAQEEAQRLGYDHIGTEQILVGLLAEGKGIAAVALTSVGLTLDKARDEVERIIGRGRSSGNNFPMTPMVKCIFEESLNQSKVMGDLKIGTEHVLLAQIEEGEGVASRVLQNVGIGTVLLRAEVLKLRGLET